MTKISALLGYRDTRQNLLSRRKKCPGWLVVHLDMDTIFYDYLRDTLPFNEATIEVVIRVTGNHWSRTARGVMRG